jgi:hypothetical protein
MNSAKTSRSVSAPTNEPGRPTPSDTGQHRDHQAADRDAGRGAAEAPDQGEVGLEAGQDQEQEDADPGGAGQQTALQRVAREEPVVRGRGEMTEHARAEQQAGRQLSDHRGLADRAHGAAEHARRQQEREKL